MKFLAALLLTLTVSALDGTVVKVSDGDTITVLDAAKVQHKIRFYGIDAPESKQAFGQKSKENLATLVAGKAVHVEEHGTDRYGRTIGEVMVDGKSANLAQVTGGFAWHYVQYTPKDKPLADAEKAARAAKLGLWADAAPQAPWEFRKAAKKP